MAIAEPERYTRAAIFSKLGRKADFFVRFSTVAGERGAPDAERDIRSFAIKFYTEEPCASFLSAWWPRSLPCEGESQEAAAT